MLEQIQNIASFACDKPPISIDEAALEAVCPTYSPHAFLDPVANAMNRGLARCVAHMNDDVGDELTVLEQSLPQGEPRMLCDGFTISNKGCLVSPELWRQCAYGILNRLNGINEDKNITADHLQSGVNLLMRIVATVITADLNHFNDQASISLYMVGDKIGISDTPFVKKWHKDRYHRTYLFRTRRSAQNLKLDPHTVSEADDCTTLKKTGLRLCEILDPIQPDKADEWRRIITETQDAHSLGDPIAKLANEAGMLWRANDGDVVMYDRYVWHRSIPAKPGLPTGSILTSIDIAEKVPSLAL